MPVIAAPLLFATDLVDDMPAEDINPAELEAELSPAAAAALDMAKHQLDRLADMLSAVVDAASAATLTPHIAASYEALRHIDFSAFTEDDVEVVAAEFAEDMFLRLDAELARLADADYFGNAQLAALCAEPEAEAVSSKPGAVIPSAHDAPVPEAGTESVHP